MKPSIVVTYNPREEEQIIYRDILRGLAPISYFTDKSEAERIEIFEQADVVIAKSFSPKEINQKEISCLKNTRFIQLIFAGADNIPFELISENTTVASNVGAFAEQIAEHVLALTLALAKNLIPKNRLLQESKFDGSGFNQELRGGVCGIIGFGGNGKEIAKTMQAMGMQVFGINRSGTTEASVEFIGSINELKTVLQVSNVIVVTTPLTRQTKDLIGKKELELMKNDAILINVGRGAVINQKALYDHLMSHPNFRAGIDTWWSEPASHGEFKLDYPFFELPNIIGSPHIADHVPRSMPNAIQKALQNVKNFLLGKEIRGVVNRNDYLG